MAATLTLRDSLESVNFLDTTIYELQDNTFRMSVPQKVELRVQDNFFAGRDLLRMEYGPRDVTFDVRVLGSTQKAVSENISKIQRLLTRASSLTYLQGGEYSQSINYVEGTETGDQGVVLRLRRGSDDFGNITSELNNSPVAMEGVFTMKVIAGDVEVIDNIFGSADRTSRSPSTILENAMNNSQTTIDVNDDIFISGDRIVLRANNQYETMTITSSATPISGGFRYNVTRASGGGSPQSWSDNNPVQRLGGEYFRYCTIRLQTEPFILGPSRIIGIVSDPGFENEPYFNTGQTNRVHLAAASIPGDVDALTRIVTHENNAQGIIIGRDAGISLLNCPSVPTLDTGTDDIIVYGYLNDGANRSYKINIVAGGGTNPNTFRFSVNNGANWGPTTNIQAWVPIQLQGHSGTIDAYAVFGRVTGYTANQTWTFSNHQAYFRNTTAVNAYSNRVALMGDSGAPIHSFTVNIPPGCRSRYKMVGHITSDVECEYKMRVGFLGRGSGINNIQTEPQNYEWIGPFSTKTLDFGVIDLTSMVSPFMSHPHAATIMIVTIYARVAEEILSNSGDEITFLRGYLIPCQDEFSYFHGAWKAATSGFEVYCNYDASNPYIVDESTSVLETSGATGKVVTGLDGTYGGNVITLVPNVLNTLIVVPMLSTATDWRSSIIPTNGQTRDTYIAIRPRYLHLPG